VRACSATGWPQSFSSAAAFAKTGEGARNSRPSGHARGALFLGRPSTQRFAPLHLLPACQQLLPHHLLLRCFPSKFHPPPRLICLFLTCRCVVGGLEVACSIFIVLPLLVKCVTGGGCTQEVSFPIPLRCSCSCSRFRCIGVGNTEADGVGELANQ
jgi:hypothetical protein